MYVCVCVQLRDLNDQKVADEGKEGERNGTPATGAIGDVTRQLRETKICVRRQISPIIILVFLLHMLTFRGDPRRRRRAA